MHARISALLVAFALALTTGLAYAQETTGTISGRLVDAQGLAVPGATVTVTGPQGAKTTVTDAEGRYTAPFLIPGVYTVRAELQGFKAAETKDVTVRLGQTTGLDLNMEVGGLTETVEVTGAAATLDTRSTTSGAVLDSELFSRVPVGRRVTDTLYMAPGVSSSGTAGTANPSFAGGSGLDNQYVIDGVNVTNTGYGAIGSYSITFGSLGNATPFDFVKEVQVKTGGYEAEYGQSMGGVVNVVTKSGTNSLRGSLFGYSRPSQLEGNWRTTQTANGTVNTVGSAVHDVGVEVGFPVVKDRLFAFGAINPSWERRTLNAPDGFPLTSLGDVHRDRSALTYALKGTYQVASAHRIDASFFGDPSKGEMGAQRTSSLLVRGTAGCPNPCTSSFSELKYGGHSQTVRYDGVFGSGWLVEASFANSKNLLEETPSVNAWRVTDTRVTPQLITGGIGQYEAGNDSRSKQWAIKSTNVFGGHQLKYGFNYEDVLFAQLQQRTGPPVTGHDGRTTLTGASVQILPDVNFGSIWRVTRADFTNARDTHQDYYSFFVQDSWRANDRLTINAGLRYEDEAMIGTFPELPTLDGQLLDTFRLKNNWAPRLGVVYDVMGGGRSKLYANWGRFFARVPNDLAARVLSSDESITRGDYFDAALTRPIPNGVATQTPTGAPITQHYITPGSGTVAHTFVDPDARLSYKDEIAGGFEWEAFANTNVGIRYMHRNVGRALEDVGLYPAVSCDLGSEGGCAFETYVITNPSDTTEVRIDVPQLQNQGISFEKPKQIYDAVEVTMDRRFSNNWSVLASYRLSRLFGNYEGFYRDDNGQSDPALTSLYDFPTNDPTYTSIGGRQFGYLGDIRFLGELGEGRLPLDRPHQLKIFGNYAFDGGLSLGLGLTGVSGVPLTALAGLPPYGNDSEIPMTARGGGFDTVDGFKTRTPAEWKVDMQASYGVSMGGRKLTLIADAFNLFNIRKPTSYNAATEFPIVGVTNPDFGTHTNANVSGQFYQTPFQLRLGARFEF